MKNLREGFRKVSSVEPLSVSSIHNRSFKLQAPPFNYILVVDFGKTTDGAITIYDVHGAEVNKEHIEASNKITIDCKPWA